MSYRHRFGLVAAALIALTSLVPDAADAQRDRRGYYAQRGDGYDRGGRQNYDRARDRAYDRGGDRGGRSDRGRQRCDRGTGGTLLGAIAGGLLGDAAVGRRGDRTAGTILGAGAGALAGRAIDRDC